MTSAPDSSLHLRFKGDWGAFNLTRICGWLAFEVFRRTGAVHHVIHTGRGMADNIIALGRGEVDVSIATPAGFARLALAGRGPFAGNPIPGLRAIGCLPHQDALLFALPAELGISTMGQLRDAKPKLRISLARDDGESFMGFGAAAVLRASGIEPQDILAWGGEFVYGEDPSECVEHMNEGRADTIIQEAIMTPWWNDLAEGRPLRFLSLEDDAAQQLEEAYGLTTLTVEAGFLNGMDEPVRALDFTGWQVLVRDDLDDEVAEMLAAIMVENSETFEGQYRHIPVRFSPLAYPITAQGLAATAVPLHPGAERYYRSAGVR
jgi:TRAP-type uncharacterized transport system substrate-binding protein